MAKLTNLFINRAQHVMKYLGVWVPDESDTIYRKLYKIFMLSLQYTFLLFQMIFVVQTWGDWEAVADAVYVLFTQASLCCKIGVFHINYEGVRELCQQMNNEVFRPTCVVHERILQIRANNIKRLLLCFIGAAQMTCLAWGVAALPLFDNGSRKFPFVMWMPVKSDSSPQYEIGFLFQELTICTSAMIYYGVDSVAFSMVIFACAQMEIIMEKILSVILKNDGFLTKHYLNGNKILIECVKHYQAVITFKELVENTFHIYMFFQLIGTVGIIVMSAFRILVLKNESFQFISTIIYVIVMVSQIYLCCWCGHELTATNEKLHKVLYMSLWYEQDVKFQRALCFMMARIERPLVLRAGHYISLSRQTFVGILRMSYSYIAVLNQTM
ncbi:odorant receptor Or1-like [Pieris brassicae]|uniref:odorant receptor Or1-like n=1 Tax=Pieris brassicae TaxID=7116 RepID=UPI001E661246|nr:odorant receptor Or1-like [Pieris brassicae]